MTKEMKFEVSGAFSSCSILYTSTSLTVNNF